MTRLALTCTLTQVQRLEWRAEKAWGGSAIWTLSLWLQQALRQRRQGLGKVLGTEKLSDLRTKHVDAKLLGEHVRCMGFEFVVGRAEPAPQVVQDIDDDAVGYVDDVSSGLMTASTSQESATYENHCALDSEVSIFGKF